MMNEMTPLMIVMTPVRNEAWVLRLFLTVTSRWADHIVIADQMSEDGSREIALSFPKVTLINNDTPEFNEAERQAMLIAKAREIAAGRDCILVGLDADEIFDARYRDTEDWKKILNSHPGDVFFFKWAEICPDKKQYWISPKTFYPWMFHDDGKEPHGNYVRNMHSMRIPYPIEEKQLHYVNDFRVLHFAYVNRSRVESKRRFYEFVDWELNSRNVISLSRAYTNTKIEEEVHIFPKEYAYSKEKDGFDMWELVNTKDPITWMDDYILDRIQRHPMKELRKLDIWDDAFLRKCNIHDPRSYLDKLVHKYLACTAERKNSFFVHFADKVLKLFY